MERHVCPYCKKNTFNNLCEFCNLKFDEFNETNKLMYDLKIAIINDDKFNIRRCANELPKTNLINYYLSYSNNEECNFKHFSDLELIEVGLHKKDDNFIKTHVKNKELLNHDGNFDIKLLENVEIQTENRYIDIRSFGKALLILSGVLSVIFILITFLITQNIRLYYQVILLIFPGILFTTGLFKFFKKKTIKLVHVLITILFIYLITYLLNIKYNTNIITHTKEVFFSIYNLLKYYVNRGINL